MLECERHAGDTGKPRLGKMYSIDIKEPLAVGLVLIVKLTLDRKAKIIKSHHNRAVSLFYKFLSTYTVTILIIN